MNAPTFTPFVDVYKNTETKRVVLPACTTMQEAVSARRKYCNKHAGNSHILKTKNKEDATRAVLLLAKSSQ